MPNADVLQKWLTALRSGFYGQTQGFLRQEDSYCCLGVLCDLYDRSYGADVWRRHGEFQRETLYAFECAGETRLADLPIRVADWLGIDNNDPIVGELIELNDTERLSFPEIADYIEANLRSKEDPEVCA